MISKVSVPKWATIRLAITVPTPLISSLPRYSSIPLIVVGFSLVSRDLKLRSILSVFPPEANQSQGNTSRISSLLPKSGEKTCLNP